MATFFDVFARSPAIAAEAPGRVNLLGEHTDYNEGLVLPIGIPQTARVEIAPSIDADFHVYSADLDERVSFSIGASPSRGFARYMHGCIEVLARAGYAVPALCIRIESTVPMGVGLSSSAALEVAALRAIRRLLQAPFDDVELAKLAQQAEVEYVGVRCGIMDQMASSLGDCAHMLYLDTRCLEHERLALPAGCEIVVLDSGSSRELASSAYNERRRECEVAARLLGLESLRDAHDLDAINALPPPYDRRARHIVTENARVCAGLRTSAAQFGLLMNESHESLRVDYEVSSPALDALARCLRGHADVYGARLTGAGFGGACVALARNGTRADVAAAALQEYARLGFEGGRSLV